MKVYEPVRKADVHVREIRNLGGGPTPETTGLRIDLARVAHGSTNPNPKHVEAAAHRLCAEILDLQGVLVGSWAKLVVYVPCGQASVVIEFLSELDLAAARQLVEKALE